MRWTRRPSVGWAEGNREYSYGDLGSVLTWTSGAELQAALSGS